VGFADRHPDELADGQAPEPDAQGPRIEAHLAAGRTGDVFAVAAEENPDLDLVFLALEVVEEALDPVVTVPAVDDEALPLGPEVLEGDLADAAAPGFAQSLLQALGEGLGPRFDRPALEGLGPVGDDLVLVDDGQVAKAVAFGAGALGAVEGEEVRERVLGGLAADPALELVGEAKLAAVLDPDLGPSTGFFMASRESRPDVPAPGGRW
jgi:hypothetical protein